MGVDVNFLFEGKDLDSIGYLSWGYNQPDNDNGNENCGAMDINGDLVDMPCNFPAVFFCETESKSQIQLDARFSKKISKFHNYNYVWK